MIFKAAFSPEAVGGGFNRDCSQRGNAVRGRAGTVLQ